MKNIELYINKMGDFYKLIDRTFSIKNPPLDFPDVDKLVSHIRTTYGNNQTRLIYGSNKLVFTYDRIYDGEKKFIEEQLKDLL